MQDEVYWGTQLILKLLRLNDLPRDSEIFKKSYAKKSKHGRDPR
jgi:hypothetical protein